MSLLVKEVSLPEDADWLVKSESLHRQLRPQLPADYCGRMKTVLLGGAHLLLAIEGSKIIGLALWRLIENTYEGRRLYVDDLVVDDMARSQGTGKALLEYLESVAKLHACNVLALDSGVQRGDAHKFYFREGLQIAAYSFRKVLI